MSGTTRTPPPGTVSLERGVFTTLDDPFATGTGGGHGTFAHGINEAGQIVGSYTDNTGTLLHGFLRSSSGVFTTLDDPLATNGTEAFGINDAGQIVGVIRNGTVRHGFLLIGGCLLPWGMTLSSQIESRIDFMKRREFITFLGGAAVFPSSRSLWT